MICGHHPSLVFFSLSSLDESFDSSMDMASEKLLRNFSFRISYCSQGWKISFRIDENISLSQTIILVYTYLLISKTTSPSLPSSSCAHPDFDRRLRREYFIFNAWYKYGTVLWVFHFSMLGINMVLCFGYFFRKFLRKALVVNG